MDWQDTEESEEQCVMNDFTGLSLWMVWMSLICSYDFILRKRTFETVLENSVKKTMYKNRK